MNILVACEESQAVTIELRKLGHQAFSCDIIECSGGHPEWHIRWDALSLLNGNCCFLTTDGNMHKVDGKWDMIIAFPPCTFLTVTGNRWFNVERYGEKAVQRHKDREDAINFFMAFANADCEKIAIENPVGIMSSEWRKPNQIINPYEFGDPFEKKTCLWLKGLQELKHTNIVDKPPRKHFDSGKSMPTWYAEAWHLPKDERAKMRSKTFPGIAKAMAEQLAGYNGVLGEWIESPACDNTCSECGMASGTVRAIAVCPNCGHHMRTDYIWPSVECYEADTGKNPWKK